MIFEKYNLEIPLKNKLDISNIETNKQGLNLDDETEITNDLPFKGNEDFNSLNNDEGEKSIGVDDSEDDVKERIEALSKPILSLGITISEVTEEVSKKSNYPQGLFVKGVEQNSAAEASGISIGDVIIEFDGKQIKTADDLTKAKEEKKAGDKVDIVVCRNGKNIKLQLELTEG